MPFASVNAISLHYRLHGPADGLPLVLANSLGTDARIWDAVIAILSQRYRVLSYDKRGHGQSEVLPGDYALDDHVADLAGLLDHLGIDRLALCGVSVGGLIAQRFAVLHPGRLAALVLCDTAPRIGDTAMWNARIAAIRSGGMAAIADAVMVRWFSERYRSERPDELAVWRQMVLDLAVDGYAGTCATLRDADLRDEVGAIATPTLVVVGDADASTPVELVRDAADRIAGARFEIIAGAGHLPSIEQPAALAALMTQFFHEVGYD